MPKKSTKSKSKRTTLKHKYKVIRKVKEHHRKKRRDERKSGIKRKAPKDPGIPNAWPFKEELIQGLTAQKEREKVRAKAMQERVRAMKAGEDMDHDGTDRGLQHLQATAAERGHEFEHGTAGGRNVTTAGGMFVDSSRKAFYKEFTRVVNASDVIIEVLDARDPMGCRCLEVERFIRKVGASKKIILVLNKIDLVPREVAEAWLKYLREELPAVAFKCSTQRQATNLGRKQISANVDAALKGSECLGAETLLQLLKNYARSANIKTAITVGVVGLPNVGKSSLINSLKRTRVAQVGNMPGVTKSVQEIHLDKHVTLLDSPGVVFSDASADGAAAAALRNCVKVEQLDDPTTPVAEIVRRCPAKQLMTTYKVPAFADADEFLQHVAKARGKLKRGGTVDVAAAARIVLQDWNDGRIPFYTMPPKRDTEIAGSATLVATWGAEFDADTVFANENSTVIAALPSVEDAAAGYFQTETAGDVHIDIDAMEEDEQAPDLVPAADGDAMDEGEPQKLKVSSKKKQNEQLYAAPEQFNPHAARADRKRRKKADKGVEADEEDGDSEYDWQEDWDDADDGANAFAHLAEDSDDE